jgi:hypothetical protein
MSSELDAEWAEFLRNGCLPTKPVPQKRSPPVVATVPVSANPARAVPTPAATDTPAISERSEQPTLTISTQSINAKLNNVGNIDINAMYWALEVMPYNRRAEGVIKKQIKVQCNTPEELIAFKARLEQFPSHELTKVEHIDDPGGAARFQYVAKLSIGLANKEVQAHRAQQRDAFFNSFTMVLRVRYQGEFKEITAKVFNKGIMSLPGMLDMELRENTLSLVDRVLGETSTSASPSLAQPLAHRPETISDVMVNSNFWCGYGLDRDKVVELMRGKYGLEASYDPSEYPGVICRYYHSQTGETHGRCPCNPVCSTLQIGNKKAAGRRPGECQKMTFMLFRTGSVLIVGRHNNEILHKVFRFVLKILQDDRKLLESEGAVDRPNKRDVRKKPRRRTVWVMA